MHGEALKALALLAALPERKRSFLAAKVAGRSYDEIAAELNVSRLTVNRQSDARPRGAARTRDVDRQRTEACRTPSARHCERPGTPGLSHLRGRPTE